MVINVCNTPVFIPSGVVALGFVMPRRTRAEILADRQQQPAMSCAYCGGDPFAPDHEQHCDGRQGGRDDGPPTLAAATAITITAAASLTALRVDAAERIRRHRETSVRSFYKAVDNGKIETLRQRSWAALLITGPATINETQRQVNSDHTKRHARISAISPRFAELRDLGIIREVGQRPCMVTGELCIVWEAVPSHQHGGIATIHRCATCGQVVSRDKEPDRVRARREGARV